MAEECSEGYLSKSIPCEGDSDSCFCYIQGYCLEGEESYRSCSPVSWQHFPRSTSTRSRCDDSSTEIIPGPSYPNISCKSDDRKESELSTSCSTVYPITKSIAQLNAEHYLKIRNIHGLFNFLIGHLICAEPDDPIKYLMNILERCLYYRDYGAEEPPLLVTEHHIRSLYKTFDVYGKGSITVDQYEVAMENIGLTKGLTQPSSKPPLNEDKMVDEDFFISEASRCLRKNFHLMFRIPKDWEEKRLVWEAMMKKRPIGGKKAPSTCNCDIEQKGSCRNIHRWPRRKMSHEPEQLFLTT